MLKTPVAERNDDIVEFEALTLVDREDADAVGGDALDSFATDGLLPFRNKGIDVCAVVEGKLVELVVEHADICTFCFKPFQLE